MAKLGLDDWVSINPAVLIADVEGEVVMMDVDHGAYFTLNRVGSHIWRRLGERTQLAALCRDLAREFDAPVQQIEAETLALIQELSEKNLVVVA